jgi:hypothetical protein
MAAIVEGARDVTHRVKQFAAATTVLAALIIGCKKEEKGGAAPPANPSTPGTPGGNSAAASKGPSTPSGSPQVQAPKPRPATGPATAPSNLAKDPGQLPLREGSLTQAQVDALVVLTDRAAAATDQIAGEAREPNRQQVATQRRVIAALAAATAGDIAPAGALVGGDNDIERQRETTFAYAVRLAISYGRTDELAKSAAALSTALKLTVAKMLLEAGKPEIAANIVSEGVGAICAAASPDANGISPDVLEAARLLALAGKPAEALSLLDAFKPQVPQAVSAAEEVRMVVLAAAGRPADAAAVFTARLPAALMNYRPHQVSFLDATRDAARFGAGREMLTALIKASAADRTQEMAFALAVSIAEGAGQGGQKTAAEQVLGDLEALAGTRTDLLVMLERGARAAGDPAASARIRLKLGELAAASSVPPQYHIFTLAELYLDAGDVSGASVALNINREKDQPLHRSYVSLMVLKALATKGDRNGAIAIAAEIATDARQIFPTFKIQTLYQIAALLKQVGDAAGAVKLIAEAQTLLAEQRKGAALDRNTDGNWELLEAQFAAGDKAGSAETFSRAQRVATMMMSEPQQGFFIAGALAIRAAHGDIAGAREAADALKDPMSRTHAYTTMVEKLLGPAAERPPKPFN